MSVSEIIAAFEKVTAEHSSTHSVWVKPYQAASSASINQFVFFLKPEVTAAKEGVKVADCLELALNTLTSAGVHIGAIRVIGGPYLDKNDIMVQHYGVISKISKEGLAAISESAREVLYEKFADELKAGAEVLGGHQFLAKFKQFNPFSLLVVNDNLGTTRLAGGTYVMKIKVLGKLYLVLNPFHSFQLVPYTTPGNAIIVFEGLSSLPWADLRNNLTGVTDPSAALPGSIRNKFLTNKVALGLKDVDKGTNGVHLSAGPLEGLVELKRFFSDHDSGVHLSYTSLAFGAYLQQKGSSVEHVDKLASNPDAIDNGKKTSLFDLTEEKSYDEAATALLNAKL